MNVIPAIALSLSLFISDGNKPATKQMPANAQAEEVSKDDPLLSAKEEAQWTQWEKEWKKEEKKEEEDFLKSWIPTGNSQMPNPSGL